MRKNDALKVFKAAVDHLEGIASEFPQPDYKPAFGVAAVRDIVVQTKAGPLKVYVYLDSYRRGRFGFWIAQRFEDYALALKTFPGLGISPSGKWNFHYPENIGPESLDVWRRCLENVCSAREEGGVPAL